jgi:hypothetical protein
LRCLLRLAGRFRQVLDQKVLANSHAAGRPSGEIARL